MQRNSIKQQSQLQSQFQQSQQFRNSIKSIRVSSKHEIIDQELSLLTTFSSCIHVLQKLSDDNICLLRTELQINSFYYLNQIIYIKFNQSLFQSSLTSSTSTATSTSIQTQENSNNNNIEINIINSFNQYLIKSFESIKKCSTIEILCVIISPLTQLIPNILLNCIKHLFLINNNSINNSNNNSHFNEIILNDLKIRLLKLIVIIQQNFLLLLETSLLLIDNINASYKQLYDNAINNFELIRKYVLLTDKSLLELKVSEFVCLLAYCLLFSLFIHFIIFANNNLLVAFNRHI